MCGIAGIISKDPGGAELRILQRMTDAIDHRGPDGEGAWRSSSGKVALGHRRLAILDLSKDGAQPMHYGGRYTIVFNGEIYNYLEIRAGLLRKGYTFRSDTDTEVLMALYADKGVDALQELDGMFSFALYDAEKGQVFFARDRFGEKPLFYGRTGEGSILFGSEMKTLWAAGLPKQVDEGMLYRYLATNTVEDEEDKGRTFYTNIRRLPAAHYALVGVSGAAEIRAQRYWNIDPQVRNRQITESEAAEEFRRLFYTSVSRRLRSDVAVGSSLSGGLDSSLVVRAIDDLDHSNTITRKTFSAHFPGFEKDERRYQDIIIACSNVEPHFVQPAAESMLANLPRVMHHQEEPFGSASICVQYEVFGLAKTAGVTVLLDGQGADEVMAGYHSYYAPYFTGLNQADPGRYKAEHAAYLALQSGNTINTQHRRGWKEQVKSIVPARIQDRLLQRRRAAYSGAVLLHPEFKSAHSRKKADAPEYCDLQAALYHDTVVSGLELLLRFADRNSMAHSREVRLPFLYHELVEFLFTLPDHFKIHDGWTKWIMRTAVQEVVPKAIVWRRDKIGYEPPQQQWLREAGMQKAVREAAVILADHRILANTGVGDMSPAMQWKVFSSAKMLYQ